MDTRVQNIGDKFIIEVRQNVVEKRQYSEDALLKEQEYFSTMREKADAGLVRVNALLAQISNAKKGI